jgi:tetratricopeptide (TPR) repeat protein
MLGTAYLHQEDIGGAYSCFRRVQSLDFRNRTALIGLAAVLVRRGESDKAVQLYIEMLERNPSDRAARRALNFVRHCPDPTALAGNGKKLRSLYPLPPARMVPYALATLVLAVGVLGWFMVPVVLDRLEDSRPSRPGIAEIVLTQSEQDSPVGSEGGFEIILSEKDALATFESAKKLFNDYRDEAALVEINRLLLSNASRQVKAKAEALARYAREPSFISMPDRFAFTDVDAFPRLYDGVAVIWKGLPANIENVEVGTHFDLLVGYHDKRKLDGIVAVRAPFELRLPPDRPVEVLARVKATSGGFILECVAVHEL